MTRCLLIILISFYPILDTSAAGKPRLFLFLSDTTLVPDTTQQLDTTFVPDSLLAYDSLKHAVVYDTLLPVYSKSFLTAQDPGTILNYKELVKFDYRSTGDFFSYMPFGFLQDLGSVGQPNDVMLYSLGLGNISYLNDGIPINNRVSNSYDMNMVQSENIDSIEVLPITRGFLYGQVINPAAVNFITRDELGTKPFSRIRFYQAPNEEGYIDGMFNAYLTNRLKVYFDLTNNSVDNVYENTEFGSWKTTTKVKYLLSNKLNIIGGYDFVKSQTNLFGGVDVDSIINAGANIDEYLYNSIQAPVFYGIDNSVSSRYEKHLQHRFTLTFLGNIVKSLPGRISFYYHYNRDEFRQNEYFNSAFKEKIIHDNKYKTLGAFVRQELIIGSFNLDAQMTYERTEYKADVLKENKAISSLSAGGIARINLFDKIFPAVYARYLNNDGKHFTGFGADGIIEVIKEFRVFGGASYFEKPLTIIESQYLKPGLDIERQKFFTIEIGAKFNTEIISGSFSYFFVKNTDGLLPVKTLSSSGLRSNETGYFDTADLQNNGFNLNADIKIWKIQLALNGSYYITKRRDKDQQLPEYTLMSGLYYVDRLFNNNLDLKAGLNFRYNGKQDYREYDFEKKTVLTYELMPGSSLPSLIRDEATLNSYQLDFFLAGEVQKTAIVYFVFENLLDTQYYIVPFYPKQSRGLRFGISWKFLD